MPLRLVQEEVALVEVIMKTAYEKGWLTDYPNLAGKMKKVFLHRDLHQSVPLKLAEDGSGYRLYAGKKWVAVKPE